MKTHIQLTILLSLIFFFGESCNSQKEEPAVVIEPVNILTTEDIDIPVYNFDELEPFLYKNTNKITIINFWAMWCVPCVEELPYLIEYVKKNPDTDLLLVSQDFAEGIETKLKPFITKMNIQSKVVLLDDPDANTWIDKVNPNWSGAIPYTIIFDEKNRQYYERSFESLADLENEINKNF